MESMIDRVARALCIDAGEIPDTPTPHNPHADFVWHYYRKSARAAIEEMRMPTGGMLKAGAWSGEFTIDRYQAMIDASLKEEGEEA